MTDEEYDKALDKFVNHVLDLQDKKSNVDKHDKKRKILCKNTPFKEAVEILANRLREIQRESE